MSARKMAQVFEKIQNRSKIFPGEKCELEKCFEFLKISKIDISTRKMSRIFFQIQNRLSDEENISKSLEFLKKSKIDIPMTKIVNWTFHWFCFLSILIAESRCLLWQTCNNRQLKKKRKKMTWRKTYWRGRKLRARQKTRCETGCDLYEWVGPRHWPRKWGDRNRTSVETRTRIQDRRKWIWRTLELPASTPDRDHP